MATKLTFEPRRKLALVIGIGDYENVTKLRNPQNDAKALSSLLQRMGFNTAEQQLDKTCAQLKNILVDFEHSIESNDIVLLYFAGHGVTCEGQYYLLPKDFPGMDAVRPLETPALLKRNAINAQDILNNLGDRNPYFIISLLDCDSQYLNANKAQSVELTAMHNVDSLIAFACASDTLVDDKSEQQNSLFMKHLLKHLATTSVDIENILRDVTNGVMEDSNSKQIPYVCIPSKHKNIYLCEQAGVNSPANATWAQQGVTIAGGHGAGSGTNQLSWPQGLFVDDDQTVIIADFLNHRIIQWNKDDTTNGKVVAGGNGQGNRLNQLNQPTDVLIDRETGSLIICDWGNRRVVQWSRRSGTTQGKILIDDIKCWGLAMDEQRYLYVSDTGKHEVRRYQLGEKNSTLVAGGNGSGDGLNQLNRPRYLFVDRQQNVYVSDRNNQRVMKWNKGTKEGRVIAGGQGEGTALTQLYYPYGIFVDMLGTLYVADSLNHRVMRWTQGDKKQGTVIVGGHGQGAGANQFNCLRGLSFDRHGNLYVVDENNHRVQRFSIK
ncbi:unnamed protein product [Rotaria socialis]|uniref:Caspase family p20 domain-containing protein n=1 Tax=Rotaria socialis TaxID=392032 RepID=A0A819BMV3_9BILA|nr:unnamed protein product [Rotaria socialis]CAF4877332.1 unnamed protein product [Rotaria socialis]